jgi:hypothetical protein
MCNIKVNINVGFSETEEPLTENDSVERVDDDSFILILDSQDNKILIAWKMHSCKQVSLPYKPPLHILAQSEHSF